MLVRYLLKVIDAWRAKMKKYRLKITPAIIPTERHKIEDVLKELGYYFVGGGTHTDMSSCDISFEKLEEERS